jgi:hypothetical protein
MSTTRRERYRFSGDGAHKRHQFVCTASPLDCCGYNLLFILGAGRKKKQQLDSVETVLLQLAWSDKPSSVS